MTALHPDQAAARRLAGLDPSPSTGVHDPATGDGSLVDEPGKRAPLVLGNRSFGDVTNIVCGYIENKPARWWLPAVMLTRA